MQALTGWSTPGPVHTTASWQTRWDWARPFNASACWVCRRAMARFVALATSVQLGTTCLPVQTAFGAYQHLQTSMRLNSCPNQPAQQLVPATHCTFATRRLPQRDAGRAWPLPGRRAAVHGAQLDPRVPQVAAAAQLGGVRRRHQVPRGDKPDRSQAETLQALGLDCWEHGNLAMGVVNLRFCCAILQELAPLILPGYRDVG